METNKYILEFEKPINDLYKKIDELSILSSDKNKKELNLDISIIKDKAEKLREKVYSNLEPIQIVQIARHPERPLMLDYVKNVFDDFLELHGDRYFGDDTALIGGFSNFEGQPVMVIGQQKGASTKMNLYRNFGMPQPEGYRKALRLMKMAEKFNIPIITLVDTPGAYPGLGSEERGVAEAIAHNLQDMAGLSVPIISIIIGEGGSGGALGIAIGNKVAMLKYSIYSVITPEGCAAILWRDAGLSSVAADSLGIISEKLLEMKVVDEIIEEPLGGAHSDRQKVYKKVKIFIKKELKRYSKYSKEKLIQERYDRFRSIGEYYE
ncbi:MAG: acetyl-CoA carboxylase carboxyltransferase subunit alpha [Candidatus Margulisbacteria bacterium GWF2_35_9]|nr:MAG: acetyl-CoA carboxylase carboxyltransferase subunit alpha [Candidatus Margulisbacteria bacterium GWF2_35_9]